MNIHRLAVVTVIAHAFISDGQFPIEMDSVRRDHAFLEPDDLDTLFRLVFITLCIM